MKIAAIISFICFMGVSVYFLLNEKNMKNPHGEIAKTAFVSHAKKIGEQKRSDLPVYELQRQQIDSTTIYKFESKDKDENYEMNEEELDAFSRGLNGLRDARDAGQVKLTQPNDILNQNIHEKDYFMYDR